MHDESAVTESALRFAWQGTERAIKSLWFWVAELVIGPLVGLIAGTAGGGVLGAVALIIAVLVLALIVFATNVVSAPYRQRNIVRKRLRELEAPSWLRPELKTLYAVGGGKLSLGAILLAASTELSVGMAYLIRPLNSRFRLKLFSDSERVISELAILGIIEQIPNPPPSPNVRVIGLRPNFLWRLTQLGQSTILALRSSATALELAQFEANLPGLTIGEPFERLGRGGTRFPRQGAPFRAWTFPLSNSGGPAFDVEVRFWGPTPPFEDARGTILSVESELASGKTVELEVLAMQSESPFDCYLLGETVARLQLNGTYRIRLELQERNYDVPPARFELSVDQKSGVWSILPTER